MSQKQIIHKKLVRDKIPQILSQRNIAYFTKTLNDKEYAAALHSKLQEEVNELFESKNTNNWLEEIADILEVLKALLEVKGFTFNDLEKAQKEKFEKRGGFSQKIFLEKTLEEK